jgi:hypothetical protein
MKYVPQLEKVISGVFKNYRGCLLERKDGYWICLGEKRPTLKEVDIVIDKAANALANSIKTKTPANTGACGSKVI